MSVTKQISDGKINNKKKVLKHLSKIGVGMLSFVLMTSPVWAIEPASPLAPSAVTKHASRFEKGKKKVKSTLKLPKKVLLSKPVSIFSMAGLAFVVISLLLEE